MTRKRVNRSGGWYQTPGVPVRVTVTHLDALVLARSAFHRSVDDRSVMAFGTARILDGRRNPARGNIRTPAKRPAWRHTEKARGSTKC